MCEAKHRHILAFLQISFCLESSIWRKWAIVQTMIINSLRVNSVNTPTHGHENMFYGTYELRSNWPGVFFITYRFCLFEFSWWKKSKFSTHQISSNFLKVSLSRLCTFRNFCFRLLLGTLQLATFFAAQVYALVEKSLVLLLEKII